MYISPFFMDGRTFVNRSLPIHTEASRFKERDPGLAPGPLLQIETYNAFIIHKKIPRSMPGD